MAAPPRSSAPTDEPSKPERILQTAERLFGEVGHASLTVDAIAREAGVSRGLLHYYFSSMEDILAQVVRRKGEEALATTGALVRSATSGEEVIDGLVGGFRAALDDRPNLYALYYEAYVQARVHTRVRDELAALYRTRRQVLADHLAAAEAGGLIALPHGAEATSGLVLSLADGAALQYLSDPSLPVAEVQAAARSLFGSLFAAPRGRR